MADQIISLGKESREKLIEGINILADAVVSTMGCNGRNVLFEKEGKIVSTKDGVSVAKMIEHLEDPISTIGAKLIKQASIKTAEEAGDGTTTSTLLAREIVKHSLPYINNGANVVEVKKGMEVAVNQVIEGLQNSSEEIKNEDQLKQIATISSNGDETIGKLITSALNKVGPEGVVTIESSKTGHTFLETVEGMQFDRGYKSHFFVTDNSTMTARLDNPLILITDEKISQAKEIIPLLESVSSQNRPLLIIAQDIDHEALATLIVNKARGTLKVAAVKAPDFGDRRKLILEDIACLTGGVVFSKEKGMKFDKFSWDWFGETRTVNITKDSTTIIDGKGNEDSINQRLEELKNQIDNSKSMFEKEKLQERLANMVGGVAIIHVGGKNETEIGEVKDRVEDALFATKAAIQEGIVAGGGSALLYAREYITHPKVDNEFAHIGKQIIYKVCGKPFKQILLNAGYSEDDMYPILDQIGQMGEVGQNPWFGFDISKELVVNMKESGIIDPLKVTRIALENALSVASTIMLTECVIVDKKSENESTNPMSMNPMGGMF